MTKDIGRFLQELRKSKGLTQKELAEQIGISDKTNSPGKLFNESGGKYYGTY